MTRSSRPRCGCMRPPRKLERPRFLTQPPAAPWSDVDVFIAADRAAWEDRPLHVVAARRAGRAGGADGQRSVELIAQLATLRRPTRSPSQLVHGDLYGTVLFAGTAAPGITDITPYWRPASWAAGVVVVDALAWGEADDGLVERWSALPEWPQMLLRALMFRLAVHALHPRSTAAAFPGLARTAALVRLNPLGARISLLSERVADLAQTPPARPWPARPRRAAVPAAGWPGAAPGARGGDHPVPRQVRGVGPHDPPDDARAGKPCGGGDVTVGGHPARRDRGDERADRLDLLVGDRRPRSADAVRGSAPPSRQAGRGHHVVAVDVDQREVRPEPRAQRVDQLVGHVRRVGAQWRAPASSEFPRCGSASVGPARSSTTSSPAR